MNNSSRAALTIMILTIIGKLLGFFSDSLLGYKFGASFETDAYLMAIMLPTVLFASISAGINTTFIPIFIKIKESKGLAEAFLFSNKVVNLVLLISLLLIGVLWSFSDDVVNIVAPGFNEETSQLTIELLQYTLFMSVFVTVAGVYSGLLQSEGRFGASYTKNISQNTILIIAILGTGYYWGIKGVAIGTFFAMASHVGVQLPFLYKTGYKYKFTIRFKDREVVEMIKLSLPIILSTSVLAINLIVDRILVSQLEEGSITALTFANKVNQLVYGVFIIAIITVVFPDLSKMGAQENREVFKDTLSRAIKIIIMIVAPIICLIIVMKVSIIELLFEHGAFTEKNTLMTSVALFYYSLGLIGYGVQEMFNRAFYSLKETKIPMYNAISAVMLNIILSLILVQFMGIGGVALATSISFSIRMVLLSKKLKDKIGEIFKITFWRDLSKICLSTFILYLVVWFCNKYILLYFGIESKMMLMLCISAITSISLVIYFIILSKLRVEEVFYIKKIILKRNS